jgi:hypothetical protein
MHTSDIDKRRSNASSIFYPAIICRKKEKKNIIEVAQQEQQQYQQQVLLADATLHLQRHFLVSVSATTQEDPRVVGHCGLLGICR